MYPVESAIISSPSTSLISTFLNFSVSFPEVNPNTGIILSLTSTPRIEIANFLLSFIHWLVKLSWFILTATVSCVTCITLLAIQPVGLSFALVDTT